MHDRARTIALAATMLASAFAPAAGWAQDETYLKGAPVALSAGKAPTPGSDSGLLDLYLVRKAQADAGPAARTEAYDDASAYFFDDILPRFSEAANAQTPLSATNHPVLAHVLRLALEDAAVSSRAAKAANPRVRPYAEAGAADPDDRALFAADAPPPAAAEITPCYTYKLGVAGSYPSGHSANGYMTALVLAQAFPDRRAQLLARGARYGDNRIVCGVHHPIDVERGRAVAKAVFAAVAATPAFRQDIACAREEAAATPASAGCTAIRQRYLAEMVARRTERLCGDLASGAPRPAQCAAPRSAEPVRAPR